ncbi:endolytic transglycosylase MltG [Patescibacteria group bacterium]|nr:endolytic transglycosylase MltG [Patescibacteria group bacterium]
MRKIFIPLLVVLVIGSIGLVFAARKLLLLRQERDYLAAHSFRQDIQITIIEGKRREEIAVQLQKAGICSASDFLAYSTGYEGYLFPDTYRFFPNTSAADVVKEMYANYQKKIGSTLHPSRDQVILASIIEREAENDTDRPLIAGVFTNRLAIGQKLESDATVQYAKDSQEIAGLSPDKLSTFVFWQNIVPDDIKLNSPFNTYGAAALPPAPIANPGRASILAAMNPAHHNDYYFLYKNGQLLLSKTLAEHESKL